MLIVYNIGSPGMYWRQERYWRSALSTAMPSLLHRSRQEAGRPRWAQQGRWSRSEARQENICWE